MISFFQDLISPAMVRALGWTLLHALWQAALVALLLRGGLRIAQRATAATRYILSTGALVMLLVLSAGTFARTYEPPRFHSMTQVTVMTLREVPAPAPFQTVDNLLTPVPDWRDRLELTARTSAARLEPWLPVLVAVWALGLALMLVRLGGGLLVVRRLRRVGVAAVPPHWQECVTTLAQLMGIRRGVALLESGSIGGLVTVGWLKPVVLLPVGLINGLPVAQLEAILAHELAHIRRHDYVLNLLQSVIEAIFFFHPAVWWMSAQVRLEREHCCDDLAVEALGGDARPLARALAALAAWQPEPCGAFGPNAPALPRLSLAATGGALLTRVRRLLVPTAEEATRPAGALAGGGAAALALLLVFTISALLRAPLPAQAAHLPKFVRDVLPPAPAPEEMIEPVCVAVDDTTKNAAKPTPNLIIVKDKKNRLREVYVDGKKVPKDRMDEYAPLVDEALKAPSEHPRAEVPSETDMAAGRRALRQAERESRRHGGSRSGNLLLHGNHTLTFGDNLMVFDGKVVRLDSLERKLDNTLTRAFDNLDFSNVDISINGGDEQVRVEAFSPVPPVPPVPPVAPIAPIPPAPPAVPAIPALPRMPKANDAKARQRYEKQMAEYGKKMEAYGRQMEAYGQKMEAYQQQYDALNQGAAVGSGGSQSRSRRKSREGNGYVLPDDAQSRSAAQEARREALQDRQEALREAAEARREAAEARREALQEAAEARREAIRDAEEARREAEEDRREAEAEARRGSFRNWPAPAPPAPPAPPKFETNQIGDELRRDGLIDKEARRYSLSYEHGELLINGRKQSEEVTQKYRKLLDLPANDRNSTLQIQVSED